MSWLNKQWSKLDFWDKEENERQKQQFAKPTPQTKPAVPQSVDWKTKNAKFGVLANNPQRQKSFLNDIAMPNQAVTNARNIASGIVEAPVKIGKTLGKGFWETGDAAKQLPGALLGKNNGFKESLDQSIIGGVGRFGQSLASAGLSPVTNSLADRERKRSERLLIPAYENLYRASGADPRLGRNQAEQEALGADYTIRTDPLNRSNIGVNDSLGTTARKVTAQAGEAILDTATAPAMGLATGKAIVSSPTKQFLKSTLDSGLLSGGGNLLYTAQQDNVTPLDYAKSGGLGFATGIALPVGTRLVKEMPRFVDQNIPRTAFRETELGKRATWVTPNRKLAEQFKRPETVAEAYTYRKKDILDPSDNRTRSRLIERYGENKINNLTSDTLNGRFNDQLEAPARKIAKEMGYKGAAFDEPILPSDPRSLRRNPLSINVFDQSALKSKQLLNEGGYINPSEILDSTKRAVKQLKNNGSGKAMSVEKPVDLKAEVKAPKVPRGNIEEQVVKGENTPLETAPVKSIGQLQATSRLPKDKKLRELETVKKQIIDAETESIMATKPERNLIKDKLSKQGFDGVEYTGDYYGKKHQEYHLFNPAKSIKQDQGGGYDGGRNAADRVRALEAENIDPLDSLRQEARKYKNAEEFVDSKINSYHQTDAKFDKFENTNQPFRFSGANFFLDTKPPKTIKKYLVEANTNLKNPLVIEDGNITQPMVDKAIKDGYDGIINKLPEGNGFPKRNEIAVFNPETIQTRQQLTDLYNQATKKQGGLRTLMRDEGGGYDGGRNAQERVNKKQKMITVTDDTGKKIKIPESEWDKEAGLPQPKQQKQPTQKYQNGSLSGKQTEVLPQKQITQPDKAKLQNKVSSDDTIPDVDNFIKEQTTAQHIKPQKLGVKDRLMRTWIDSLAPAEDRFSQAVKDGKISQETLEKILVNNGKSLRAGTRANQDLIDSGLVDLIHKMPKKDYDNLGQVLIARHSDDLRANGIETGRKPETDAAILKKYGKQYEKQVEQFKKSTDFVLDESVKSGLISKDTAKLLRKKYPNYVPMNRVFDEMEATGSFGSNQVANLGQQTVVRKIKGSKRVVENPMESMIEKVQAMSRQSLRNEAATSWVDTLKELGEAELIKGDKKPGDSAISIFRNGTKETYKVDPVMEQAAKGLTKEQMGVINNAARKVSRVFKTGTTGVNLPFIMTNLARDQQTALLNMHKGEREVFTQLPKTIMETLGHGKLYDEAVKQGAVSTSFDMTKPNLKRTAENIRKKGASLGAFERIEDVIGRSEEFTRIQQYAATKKYWLKKGLSEEQAMNKATLAAQQNSADFSRSGDLGQIINAWLPYTNAGVQGTRAYLRAAYKNPQRYAVKAGALLVMPTIATTLYNTGTDERKAIYDDISDQDKMSSTIIVTPWAKKNEEGRWEGLIKVPKPPGISALLYPVEKGVASMRGLDPVGFNDIAKGILGFASPLGDSPNAAVSTITPQPIKPAVESIVNRDFFTGRDIVPRWLQNKPKSDQAYDYTSGTSRGIASATGQSPLSIEHLIRGYTGEVGLQGLNLSDNILNRLGVIPKEQIGGRSVTSGFSRRFTQAYDKGRESKIADGSAVGNINAISGKDASVKRDGKYVKVSDLPLGQRFQESLKNLGESGDSDYIKRNVAEIDSEMNKIYQKYGLPPAKTSTAVAKKWAEYDNRLKDGKISPLKQPAEERKLLRDTYKLQTQGATRDFLSVSSDNDMRQAIKDGLVDKKTLKSAIELDNFLVANGLQSSPTIGKKLRAELGYSTPGDKKGSKKSVASGGGNKKIIDDMIKSLLASEQGKSKLNKDLRNLIEGLSKKQYAKAKKTVY